MNGLTSKSFSSEQLPSSYSEGHRFKFGHGYRFFFHRGFPEPHILHVAIAYLKLGHEQPLHFLSNLLTYHHWRAPGNSIIAPSPPQKILALFFPDFITRIKNTVFFTRTMKSNPKGLTGNVNILYKVLVNYRLHN